MHLYTIDEYIADHRKKDTIWMVFNTRYNEIHLFDQYPTNEDDLRPYVKELTDEVARQEFLDFMQMNFPLTKLVNVFDLVSKTWIEWPYLGSIAIDADIGSDVYKALCAKYGDAYEDPISTNQALWVMGYEEAREIHQEKIEWIELMNSY